MNIKRLIVLLVVGLFGAAAFSGEQIQSNIKIVLVDSDGINETRVELDSDDLDVNLSEMQIGENQSIVDKDGRSILITRQEDGFTLDVDGKTIKMPGIHQLHEDRAWVGDNDVDTDIDVHVVRKEMHSQSMELDGVMIISGTEIDTATQAVIRSTLESAGYSNVSFTAGGDGQHQVHVIKKVVQNTL